MSGRMLLWKCSPVLAVCLLLMTYWDLALKPCVLLVKSIIYWKGLSASQACTCSG